MPGAETAIAMREDFGQRPESLPPFLEKFFNRLLGLKISELKGDVGELAPITIALFQAIMTQVETAKIALIEKLTASANLEAFTAGTENGIAKDMPLELVPLVMAALAKLTTISQNAHLAAAEVSRFFPKMLLQLKQDLIHQAALAQTAAVEELEEEAAILEEAQTSAQTAAQQAAHKPEQQRKITAQTAWFKKAIGDVRSKIEEKKLALREFTQKHNVFFGGGAQQLAQPV